MTPGVVEDHAMVGLGNNNVEPLIPRSTVQLEFNDIQCCINTFTIHKLKFGKYLISIWITAIFTAFNFLCILKVKYSIPTQNVGNTLPMCYVVPTFWGKYRRLPYCKSYWNNSYLHFTVKSIILMRHLNCFIKKYSRIVSIAITLFYNVLNLGS